MPSLPQPDMDNLLTWARVTSIAGDAAIHFPASPSREPQRAQLLMTLPEGPRTSAFVAGWSADGRHVLTCSGSVYHLQGRVYVPDAQGRSSTYAAHQSIPWCDFGVDPYWPEVLDHAMSAGPLRLRAYAHIGSRSTMEDRLLLHIDEARRQALFVLCDGIGGHPHGEVSAMAAAYAFLDVLKVYQRDTFESSQNPHVDRLCTSAHAVSMLQAFLENRAVPAVCKASVQASSPRAGTTLVGGILEWVGEQGHAQCALVSVGDSRAYLHGPGVQTRRLTRDHTMKEQLTEAQQENVDPRFLAALVSSIPHAEHVDTVSVSLDPGQTLVVASDGMYAVSGWDVGLVDHTTHFDDALTGSFRDNASFISIGSHAWR